MIYVSSDWHGCSLAEIQQLLDRAGFCESDFLFICGDVIDRGPNGAELLLWLTGMPNVQLILGNHEALMLACAFIFEEVTDESIDRLTAEQLMLVESWIENGGSTTMSGLRRLFKEDPEAVMGILDYLQDCPLYDSVQVNNRDFILVHAGLGNFSSSRSLDEYEPEELLMVRPALDEHYFPDATVIFGHTPTTFYGPEYAGHAVYTDSWICIDGGAAMGNAPLLLRLDDMKEFH